MKNSINSAKIGNRELINLLIGVANENNVDIQEDSLSIIHDVILEYKVLCEYLRKNYVVGDLDTFKMASCMLVAVNKHGFTEDKFVNASIAVDTAYKMCENPYTNVSGTTIKLEEVDFKEVFNDDMEFYQDSKNRLITSLIHGNGSSLTYFLNLEQFYNVTYGINTPLNYETKMEALNLQVNELLKESAIKDTSYTASVFGDYFPEVYVAIAEERDGSTMTLVNMVSAISMSEFKNEKNVKQNIKKR